MSKRDRRRRRKRKQRREARAERQRCRAEGRLPDHLRAEVPETRDPRARWLGLRARGGRVISFVPTGLVVELDEMDEHAPAELAAALMAKGQRGACG